MHACGHDVHITSLVGTAQLMAEKRDQWQARDVDWSAGGERAGSCRDDGR